MLPNIDNLTEDQLRALNQAICFRLNLMARAKAQSFRRGARVEFRDRYGCPVSGTVMKTNRKTVSIVADSGQPWRVHASLVKLVK